MARKNINGHRIIHDYGLCAMVLNAHANLARHQTVYPHPSPVIKCFLYDVRTILKISLKSVFGIFRNVANKRGSTHRLPHQCPLQRSRKKNLHQGDDLEHPKTFPIVPFVIWPGSAFIKPDQRNPWIKDQLGNALLCTISHLLLPNFVSCGRDEPSHMTQIW